MTDNPYQPPSPFPINDLHINGPPPRPVGISILAVLHAIGGVLICVLGVFLATRFDEDDWSTIFAWAVAIAAPLLTILSIATAIGLWRGKKWAWWLGTIYYSQFAIGGVFVLGTIFITTLVLDRPVTQRTEDLFVKHVVRIAFFSMLSWYMTTRNVFAHFRFQRLTRLRALSISSDVILLLAGLMALVTFVALSMGARFA